MSYYILTFVLAVPFWVFGGGKLPLPVNLPVGALVTFVPMTAALIVSYQENRINGVKELLRKILDYKKIRNRGWYLPIILLMPSIHVLSYFLMRWAGKPLPDPVQVPLLPTLVFFLMFFISDTGEELGWTGYALDPLQNRWRAFMSGLILGLVWVIWHAIPWIQTGNSAIWIAWQSLYSIAQRILMVWIYNNTGRSVFAVILFHVTVNVSWALFPNVSSHYDPFFTCILSWIVVAIVVFVWGPGTLTGKHQSPAGSLPSG